MKKREGKSIGSGVYKVDYEMEQGGVIYTFVGVCEYFDPKSKCVFWNDENEELLMLNGYQVITVIPVKE